MLEVYAVDAGALFNALQARKCWPSAGPPVLFDVRDAAQYKERHMRGAHNVSLSDASTLLAPSKSWWDKAVCVYDTLGEQLEDHPVVKALIDDGQARKLMVLTDSFDRFRELYPFLCARGDSKNAMKRPPPYPSCILPGVLYLGDLEDAAALPRLKEHLNVKHAITALADPPDSLKEAVREARVKHVWCNVRDVEGADIKEHFEKAFDAIERARTAGEAAFVHCSRGVSRSASLVIAYLMKRDGTKAQEARDFVVGKREIVLPNDGFWRCLLEYEKELGGKRSGVYVPTKTKRIEDLEFELPPDWAAPPTHTGAELQVRRESETLETLAVGEHQMYTFGRSLTCDFQLEHPSASRQHAALVHHQNGGVYAIDLKSSHGTSVNGKALRPYEACLLREGAEVVFGASSRSYRLVGVSSSSIAGNGNFADGLVEAGPSLPTALRPAGDEEDAHEGVGAKRSMHPKKIAKKKRRWVAGPKPRAKQSENERVAMSAGAGSGCMGPGEY